MKDMFPRIVFKKRVLIGFIAIAFLSGGTFLLVTPAAHAQTDASSPTFLITWKTTGSYIPSFYIGKALPTYGSQITASLELVSPQGKILDLSGQTIYWYVNDTLVGGGVGVQQATFPPIGDAPNTANLRVTIPNYNGTYLIHAINIPMVLPEAVIYAPYPNGQFIENPLTVQAIPYFFNIADPSGLSYTWSVNGQAGSNAENPETAQISLPQGTQSGTSVAASLSVENPNDSTVATANANLTYESQL
jgi:hypothetical protein